MKLASIIDDNLIVCGMRGSTREELYGELIDTIIRETDIQLDRNRILTDMICRENDIAIPYDGSALPHLRNEKLSDLTVALGILANPVKLKDCDLAPCRIIVVSLISPNTSDLYLKSLAAFSRFLVKPENRDLLAAAGSPREVRKYLEKIKLKNEITAEDIMHTGFLSIRENQQVAEALDMFSRHHLDQLPVVDANGRIKGVLEAADIIRHYIPNVFFMLDNLKFVTSFEPFEKIFKDERHVSIGPFVKPSANVIPPETPLIQVTLPLVKKEAAELYVSGDDGLLLGVISIHQLVHKVLRG